MTTFPDTPTIGWIGAGRMGTAMIRRLLADGHDVAVWNRTRAKAEALVDHGATVVDAVADLADRDVVFVMVASDADVEAVTTGDDGVLRRSATPRVLVECSTISSAASERVREVAGQVGTDMLVAPVSGNPKVVEAGKASLVVSGAAEVFDGVEPLLRSIAPTVTHAGDGDAARLVKIAHNVFLGVVTQSLAEITVLAERGGVPRAAFLEFLNGSVLGSVFTRYKTPALVGLDMTPTFTPALLTKDFDLGLDAARDLGVPVPVAALTRQLVASCAGRVAEDVDFAALVYEVAAGAGYELVAESTPVDDGLES